MHLEKTPYTKCELRQQTNLAPEFIKTATGGELCKLILRFSHNVEYMTMQTDIAHAQAKKLWEAVKQIRPSKQDLRRLGKGDLAGVMKGEDILNDMEERERKDQERAAKRVSGRVRRGGKGNSSSGRAPRTQWHTIYTVRVQWIKLIKAKRKAFLIAVTTTRRDMVKTRAAQKKLKKELCREIRAKAKARAKRLGIPV